MQDGNNVDDKRRGLLLEQPVVKSGVIRTGFVEKLETDELWDLDREKRRYTSLRKPLVNLTVMNDTLEMV
jgi:hypothetical protein